jgi:choline dehydrogenase-like flavoprotein
VEEFGYIVVGAGTAGCVIAARLSQDASARVLLLEAGAAQRTHAMTVPAAWPDNLGSAAVVVGVSLVVMLVQGLRYGSLPAHEMSLARPPVGLFLAGPVLRASVTRRRSATLTAVAQESVSRGSPWTS